MMQEKDVEFTLSPDAIKGLLLDKYEKNFRFIFNGKEYETNRIVADLLSPIIRDLHLTNPTMNTFYINTKTNTNFDFTKILSLVSFEPKKILKEEINCYTGIFYVLGNLKAISQIIPRNHSEITIQNVFDHIEEKQNYIMCQESNGIIPAKLVDLLEDEVEFIAKNFDEIDKEKLKVLDQITIEKIVGNKNLKLEDEDSLIKFINELYSSNHEFSYLYEYVNFLNVSEKELQNFYEIFDLNDVNHQIWTLIVKRALSAQRGKTVKEKESEKVNARQFEYKGQEFNGIIKYLTQKTGGNIHDNGTIEATSNSILSDALYNVKNLLDFNENRHFQAHPTESWACFDFKKMKIKLTNYSIKSYSGGPNNCHLRSWVIESSNDGKDWTIIDEHKDCPTLNEGRITGTFSLQQNDFSRYVRLRQTDKPWGRGNLWFYYIEFYGFLQE